MIDKAVEHSLADVAKVTDTSRMSGSHPCETAMEYIKVSAVSSDACQSVDMITFLALRRALSEFWRPMTPRNGGRSLRLALSI